MAGHGLRPAPGLWAQGARPAHTSRAAPSAAPLSAQPSPAPARLIALHARRCSGLCTAVQGLGSARCSPQGGAAASTPPAAAAGPPQAACTRRRRAGGPPRSAVADQWPPVVGRRFSTKNSPPSMICLGGCPSSTTPHHTCASGMVRQGGGSRSAASAQTWGSNQTYFHGQQSHADMAMYRATPAAPFAALSCRRHHPPHRPLFKAAAHQRVIIGVHATHNALSKLRGHDHRVVLSAKGSVQPADSRVGGGGPAGQLKTARQ